ncbi:MAG: hypothetical protein M3P53_06730 [Actinomycetota bacterium]|nr:hypothetical protein [Actinomycetota bacterium]
MSRITRAVGAGATLALLLGSSTLVGTATADHVGCGAVITANVTLDADVGPCTGTGLIVGADNLTLNLGGHRVFATAGTGEGAGILLEDRQSVRSPTASSSTSTPASRSSVGPPTR